MSNGGSVAEVGSLSLKVQVYLTRLFFHPGATIPTADSAHSLSLFEGDLARGDKCLPSCVLFHHYTSSHPHRAGMWWSSHTVSRFGCAAPISPRSIPWRGCASAVLYVRRLLPRPNLLGRLHFSGRWLVPGYCGAPALTLHTSPDSMSVPTGLTLQFTHSAKGMLEQYQMIWGFYISQHTYLPLFYSLEFKKLQFFTEFLMLCTFF